MSANRRAPLLQSIGRRLAALFGAVTLAVAGASVLPGTTAQAQEAASGFSYITPFPDNDIYKLQVYGDSLAEGLLGGIVEAFQGDTRLQIQRARQSMSGLLRNEFEDDLRAVEVNLARGPVHVAVVMVGFYDRYAWRQGSRRFSPDSDEWKAEYGRRVDRLMKMLRAKGAALYWVGLPIMRRAEVSDDAQRVNEIVRERAYVNGQKFIDVFTQFADENGTYSPYGPEVEGKIRLLREADGMHFTQAGSRKLAHFVERELKRDLNQARSERTIPLAGSETEQKRIRQLRAQTAPVPGAKAAVAPSKDGKGGTAAASVPRGAIGAGDVGQGDVRADNSRIILKSSGAAGKEESVAIEILRPAIPASVIAVVTRRESADRASQVGDSITSEISGALAVVSSVTLSPDGVTGGRRRLPPTQTPYYRVLVKGERLPPLAGRADDFSWPKPEPPALDVSTKAEPPPSTAVRLAPAKSRRPPQPNG